MRITKVMLTLAAGLLPFLTTGLIVAQVPSGGPDLSPARSGGVRGQIPPTPTTTRPAVPKAGIPGLAPPTVAVPEAVASPVVRPPTWRGGLGTSPFVRPGQPRGPRETPGSRRRARGMPVPPTAYGTASQYLSLGAGAAAGTVATIGVGPSRWPSVLSAKPFANFSPTSPISPYLSLFRRDTDLGTIDNFNTRVRPLLDQQRVNQQNDNQIRLLQLQSRTRGEQIRHLERRTRELQGRAAPPAFMDYGGYYPRLGP